MEYLATTDICSTSGKGSLSGKFNVAEVVSYYFLYGFYVYMLIIACDNLQDYLMIR